MPVYSTTSFLNSVKRRSAMPEGATTYTDAEILEIADEILAERVLPIVWGSIEDRFVKIHDQDFVADQAAYSIPERAFSQSLREVKIVQGNSIYNITNVSPEEIDGIRSGRPTCFYLMGDDCILYPTPSDTNWSLRQYYHCRPGRLIETSDAGLITAVTSTTITVSSIPSAWITGDVFDFVSKASGHAYREVDQTSTLVSGNTITFSAVPSGVVVGDYICLSGYSPLIQLPDALIPGFAQAVSGAILQYTSQPGAEEAYDTANKSLKQAIKIITPRVKGEPRPLITKNPWR